MKGTAVFVSGVIGGIVALVWGGACFIGGCAFMYKACEDKGKTSKGKPHLEEVK